MLRGTNFALQPNFDTQAILFPPFSKFPVLEIPRFSKFPLLEIPRFSNSPF